MKIQKGSGNVEYTPKDYKNTLEEVSSNEAKRQEDFKKKLQEKIEEEKAKKTN